VAIWGFWQRSQALRGSRATIGGSVATPESGLEASVVVVKTFDELEALGDGAAGKFVLFNRPMDDTSMGTFSAHGDAVSQRTQGAVHAAQAGAIASIARSMTTLRNDVPHTGAMRYKDGVEQVPGVCVSTNGADRIEALLASCVDVRLRLELSCKTLPDAPSFNVVGELVGTDYPEEIIVLGGHLDAWDVGSGAHHGRARLGRG
jgi:carboxypeptidase Q